MKLFVSNIAFLIFSKTEWSNHKWGLVSQIIHINSGTLKWFNKTLVNGGGNYSIFLLEWVMSFCFQGNPSRVKAKPSCPHRQSWNSVLGSRTIWRTRNGGGASTRGRGRGRRGITLEDQQLPSSRLYGLRQVHRGKILCKGEKEKRAGEMEKMSREKKVHLVESNRAWPETALGTKAHWYILESLAHLRQ